MSLCQDAAQTNVLFDKLTLVPTSCNIVPETPANTESYSVLAKCHCGNQTTGYEKDLHYRLIHGETLRCKFCEADIAKIKCSCLN